MLPWRGTPGFHLFTFSSEVTFDKTDRSGCVETCRRMARHEDVGKHSDDDMYRDGTIHGLITEQYSINK